KNCKRNIVLKMLIHNRITARDNGIIPKKWCKPTCWLFTDICTNANINSDLPCYHADRSNGRTYIPLVCSGFTGLYTSTYCWFRNFCSAEVNDGWKCISAESTNGCYALFNAYYDYCVCVFLPICTSFVLGSRELFHGCTNNLY